ncbi:MAG: phage portal protein [Planctomycetes bacterium]|nr:phage portal protein [Planctomycetota bacterium]
MTEPTRQFVPFAGTLTSDVVSAFSPAVGELYEAPAVAKDISLNEYARRFLSGDTTGAGVSLTEPLDPYVGSLWFYRCIRAIQTSLKGVPLRFSRKAGGSSGASPSDRNREGRGHGRRGGALRPVSAGYKHVLQGKAVEGDLVESGEVVALFERPNNYQTIAQFVEAWAGHLHTAGSVAIVKADMVGRRPRSMHVVDGRRIKPVWLKDDSGFPSLLGFEYTPSGSGAQKIPLTTEEVVYWRMWSSSGPLDGLSPATPGRLAISTDYAASLFNACALSNGGEPGAIITVPGTLSDEQRAEARAAWAAKHGGPQNARRVAIIEGGATISSLAQTFSELQFNEGKATTRLEICALLGVHPVVAGWLESAGDSSAYLQGALQMFWQQTMFPLLEDFVGGLQTIVDAMDGSIEIWADVEDLPVVQAMRLARITTAKEMFAMGVPLGDIDDLLDLGLPERPWYANGYLPIGLVRADDAGGTPVPTDDEGGPAGGDMTGLPPVPPAVEDALRRAPGSATKADGPSEAEIVHLWQASMRPWEAVARRWRGILRAAYARQGKAAVRKLRTLLGAADKAVAKAGAAEEILRIIFDVRQEAQALRASARAVMTSTADVGLRTMLAAAGLEGAALEAAVAAAAASPTITALVERQAWASCKLISDRTAALLNNTLAEGLRAGESVNELADRVQSTFQASRAKARQIARNTTGQVYSQARAVGARRAGFTHKSWIYSRGAGERRPAHIAAEARYLAEPIPADAMFEIGAARLRFPRDFAAGHPEETINCQCLAVGRFANQTARAAVLAHTKAADAVVARMKAA